MREKKEFIFKNGKRNEFLFNIKRMDSFLKRTLTTRIPINAVFDQVMKKKL